MKKNVKEIFEQNKGVTQMGTLMKSGINHYQINALLDNGSIIKLKHGIYKWQTDEVNEWADIKHLVPYGVLCLFTTALHYELTTFVSSTYHIAIPKKAKIILPDYPPIQLYYWDTVAFTLGIVETVIQETTIKVYDLEKTVCDILRFRNKVGIDIAKEVLKNYLKRPDRNLAKLNEYARQLNISTVLSNFFNYFTMKNSVTSIQARLRNLAQADGKNYQLILIRYFQLSENGKPYSNRNTHFSMKPLEQMKNVCFNGKHF